MTPLTIGACLRIADIAALRPWLDAADRDLELQDFMSEAVLNGDWQSLATEAKRALDGFQGRLGLHGPFRGLDLDNADAELQPIITARYLKALEVCEALGAVQMVLHSPYTAWYARNLWNFPNYREGKLQTIHTILNPVVKRAEAIGVTLVIENIQDVDPAHRREMVESFESHAIALSIDTGHAHLMRSLAGAPPVDYFVADAGARLAHVHLQDVDGHADRHWAIGDGTIEWRGVFEALAAIESCPHLVLELRDTGEIERSFAWLTERGLAV